MPVIEDARTFSCIFCEQQGRNGQFAVTKDARGNSSIYHSDPPCTEIVELDPTAFLLAAMEARLKTKAKG